MQGCIEALETAEVVELELIELKKEVEEKVITEKGKSEGIMDDGGIKESVKDTEARNKKSK